MGSAILTLSSPFRMNLCFLTELIFALGALGPDRVLAKQIDVNLKVDVSQGGKLTGPDPPTGQTLVENLKGYVAVLKILYRELVDLLESPTQDEIITALMAATNKIKGYTKDIEKFNEAIPPGKVTIEQLNTIDEYIAKGNDLFAEIIYNGKFDDLLRLNFETDSASGDLGFAGQWFYQALVNFFEVVCAAQPELDCAKKLKWLKKSKPNK